MVREQLIEQTAQGNWKEAGGLGILGILLSLGVTPVLIIFFALLAVGLVTMVYLLPIVLAGVVGVVTYFIGAKVARLSGIKLVASVLIASLGSLMIFSYTDLTLWAASISPYSVALGEGATAQGLLTNSVRMMQVVVGVILSGFVLLSLLVFSSAGTAGGFIAAGVGLFAAMFVGVIVASIANIEIPGLAAGLESSNTTIFSVIAIAMLAGASATYLYWRLD